MTSNSPTEERQQWECAECKRQLREDLLVKCTRTDSDFPDGEEVEYLCCECLDKSKWYCHHCGVFCAGITSYEFGPYAGFCDNCAEQIEDSCYDVEDDYERHFDDDDEFAKGSLNY